MALSSYYLLHYYAPQGEKERKNEIIKRFWGDLEKGVDHIAVALDIFRLYGMAEETSELSRMAYKKLKNSEEIMSWGIDELNQRAIFCLLQSLSGICISRRVKRAFRKVL